VDLPICANSGVALPALVEACRRAIDQGNADRGAIEARRSEVVRMHGAAMEQRKTSAQRGWNNRPVSVDRLYGELWEAMRAQPWSVVHSGYNRAAASLIEFSEPVQQAGGGWRGGGLGQGAGTPIGAALALKDTGRVSVSVVGDGELMVNPSSLWTAANLQLPLLTVVHNNRAYGNDEGHQDLMARTRGRPIENRGVGIYIEEPATDFATMASSFGVEGLPAVEDPNDLARTLQRAVHIVATEHRPVLVDVLTQRMER
jgi:thiamine pyrophosphate-dependent acetolactate synthase large subunit-like protein